MRNNKSEIQTIELIKDYVACAKYVCGLLKELVGDGQNFVGAYRAVGIPKEGYLEDDVYYNFHGVGCYFELLDTKIDIDFGPNNRCDGFDYHRLKDFKHSQSGKYEGLSDEILEQALRSLEKENVIHNPMWHPSPHLYYLQ
jgi:hypothetical protein